MGAGAIKYFNSYTGEMETESIYLEGFLRWTHNTFLGRLALHALIKRAAFSRWAGWKMDRPSSRKYVQTFIEKYGVDVSEFAEPPKTFRSFNEFFYRKLKPEARPICAAPNAAVFPADGRHFGFSDVSAINTIFIKGEQFDLSALLLSSELARRYRHGTLILSRLSPVDYHRFHFPVDGVSSGPTRINGHLDSVNPITLRRGLRVLCENRRSITHIESPQFGIVTMVEVGATGIGGIEYTYTPGIPVRKGDEKGYFKFGGSSLATFFERGCITLAEYLINNTCDAIESYARMGDCMGHATL